MTFGVTGDPFEQASALDLAQVYRREGSEARCGPQAYSMNAEAAGNSLLACADLAPLLLRVLDIDCTETLGRATKMCKPTLGALAKIFLAK